MFSNSPNSNQSSNSNDPTLFKEALIFIWEIVKVVVISLAIIIPVRYFLIQPFYVKGASMEPNFHDNEYLIINEITYRFNDPERGDVVVFRNPNNKKEFFIKRIVGLPGETVAINNGRIVIKNNSNPQGIVLEEDYLEPGTKTLANNNKEWTVPALHYFLLGDNREHSLDSRIFGPVDQDLIIGSALVRGWPVDRLGFVGGDVIYNL
ncbi:MAG: signal peptidase I [Candidatus Buchananbacteria bacterium CG10_big_fil_rev_8_21_14_0_10_42_9]|uniref:Signal peptidase I n=1 Tax=Candidatus Buchananbacteria bacterium CG10_big_fil_rev_8_21_14_0_10_42_9 TaxID=1974526 RepID=A0A2H0W105_9BACT|nr:MAG: signal peptidase I [Candidatus Buchananbacteria bacterium CG10_big_fil_rev_8_21_14_0_10_42_9]